MLSLDQSTPDISCYSDHTYSTELKNLFISQYNRWCPWII